MNNQALKHPGRWIWLPVIVLAAIGLVRLRFDAEVFDLLPSNLPAVEGLKLYERHFANARDLIITLRGKDPEQTQTAAHAIASGLGPMTNLVESVTWEAPWMEHPEQLAELLAYLWFNQPPDVFRSLAERFEPQRLTDTFAAARDELATSMSAGDIARLSYDPLGLTRLPDSAGAAAPQMERGEGLFSSPDGRFRIVYVRAQPELRNYRDCDRWLAAVEPVIAASAGGVEVNYTGRPAFVAETAAGMRQDVTISVGGTSAVIAVLFWLAHRRVKPMLWLLALLALVLCATLALGGLIFGTINVISMGFAAILLGLAVDYAVVHYQEALAHPNLSIPEIRHAIAPSIFWAAVTTISAFLVLNFGGLPGLGQLGTMVGLGVALAAAIMIFEYLPPLFPGRNQPMPPSPEPPPAITPAGVMPVALLTAVALIFGFGVLLAMGPPRVDTTANALRPRNSAAFNALSQIETNLNQARQPLWLIIDSDKVGGVAARLDQVEPILKAAVSNRVITGYTLPAPLWARPENQASNRATARELGGNWEKVKTAGAAGGFAPPSLELTRGILDSWRQAGMGSGVFWPENHLSEWILDKIAARTPGHYYALGLLNANEDAPGIPALAAQLFRLGGVHLSGWEMLGSAIFTRVQANMWKVVSPMIVLVLLSLWLAFRRWPEVLLGLGVLLLSALCLLAVMRLAGWSWNLLDLMAIPLVLGTGVDYGLFSQLALRRHHGDLAMAYQSVGRALLLCGATAVAAFTSLAFSSSAGMASLGEVCAVGIGCNVLIAVFLLPVWWLKSAGRNSFMERNKS
ncbi:MAG TPA: MMPL family transporter [Verrucomicrobiae bacterium]|jgi:predicted exporter